MDIVRFVVLLAALLLAACGPAAASAPEACNSEPGCAGPMTGDYSQFGVDLSNATKLAVAERAYVLETDRITMQGTGDDLLQDPNVIKACLGGH